jgi:hypothetical protein
LGKHFNALNDAEQASVAAFVRAEYNRLGTLDAPMYILRTRRRTRKAGKFVCVN